MENANQKIIINKKENETEKCLNESKLQILCIKAEWAKLTAFPSLK